MKKKLVPVEFHVPRDSRDETTFATVRANVESFSPLQNGDMFMLAVHQAVTLWIQKTKEGKEFLESTSEDLNIGDLAQAGIPKRLASELRKKGIFKMFIRTSSRITAGHGWKYDDRLFATDWKYCEKCRTRLKKSGKCSDRTCPFSDRFQDAIFTEG